MPGPLPAASCPVAETPGTPTPSPQAYTSFFFSPTKLTPSVPFKKSSICSLVSASLFCMRICIQPQNTCPVHPIFMIILYWNQVRFHDHLVLDNSESGRQSVTTL